MRILFLMLTLLAFSGQGYAQEQLPVTLSIRAKERSLCLGQSMTVIASIRNVSSKPVVIDTKGIGTTPEFSWNHKIGPAEYDMGTFSQFPARTSLKNDRLVVLYPSQVYPTEISYPLERDWLTRSGKYKFGAAYRQYQNTQHSGFNVWIGDVDSNKIEISIRKCKE